MKAAIAIILFLSFISFASAQTSLTDTWELYNHGDPPGGGVIMTMAHTDDVVKAAGNDWEGSGKFDANKNTGHYSWEFTDGKTGTTRFTFHPEFDMIDGYVGGSGISWSFYARRNSKPLADFTGSYNMDVAGFSSSKVMVHQTTNTAVVFFRVGDANCYGTGMVVGNFMLVDFVSDQGTEGKLYLFLSNDRQKVFLRFYNTAPTWASGGNIYIRNPETAALNPPTAWIDEEGKQPCQLTPTTGLRLSCLSSDDFEESGLCLDPRTLQLIDYWLSVAKPFRNWNGAWYDCWGRWVGTSPDGSVEYRNTCHRPETDGKTRCEYLLEHLKDARPNVGASLFGLSFDVPLLSYLLYKL